MEIFAWIFMFILVAALVGSAIAFYINDNPQFCLLALTLAVVIVVQAFWPLPVLFWVVFWIAWVVALAVSIRSTGKIGSWVALAATFVITAGLIWGPSWSLPQPSAQAYELYLKTEDGKTENVDYHANESSPGTSSDNPLVGSQTVNDTFATATLPGGTLKSWGDLYSRFDQASKDIQTDYAAAFNASANLFGGTFEELRPKLLAAEKAGVDTRVIQVVNSDISDEQARNGVREDVGGATNSLPIVRVNAAVVTTNGGVGEKTVVNKWVDGRSTVMPVLTVPNNMDKGKPEQASANIQAASTSVNIQAPCSNIATGTVEKPKPQPKPTPKTPPTGKTTSSPSPTPTPTGSTTPSPTPTPTTTTSTPTPTPTPTTTTSTPTPTPTETTSTPTPTPTPTTTTSTPTPTPTPTPTETLPGKDPSINLPGPSGKPTVGAPTSTLDPSAPPETTPAVPTTQPSSTATQSAPEASHPATLIPTPTYSDPGVAPTAGTEIGDPDATTSVVTSQAKLSADQEAANKAAADAIANQAAAEAAAKAAAEANAQAAANAAAQKAAEDAAAKAAADQAAKDAAAKAAADKAAADAAAKKAATALAAQQEADKKAAEIANQAAKDKAAEVAKSVATKPAGEAEKSPMGSSAVGFVGLPLLFFGAFRKKKLFENAERKH